MINHYSEAGSRSLRIVLCTVCGSMAHQIGLNCDGHQGDTGGLNGPMLVKQDEFKDDMNEEDDFGGSDVENVNYLLSIDCPDVVHLFQASTVSGRKALQKRENVSICKYLLKLDNLGTKMCKRQVSLCKSLEMC